MSGNFIYISSERIRYTKYEWAFKMVADKT